jgi:ribokinase
VTGTVVVLGSLNVDLVVRVAAHPRPGETVAGRDLRRLPGGKGANQAVAAARAGARTRLIGCVGEDGEGSAYVEALASRGIDVTGVRRVRGAVTGTAVITVEDSGESTIVVVPGANAAVTVEDVDLAGADVLLVQLEVPLPVVAEAVRRAAAAGVRVVLNPSPYADLPADVVAHADPVVANALEAGRLPARPRSLLTTLGADGARWETAAGEVLTIAAPAVDVVDATGAGDAFAGTLAAALAGGLDEHAALERAVAAGAEAVVWNGAQGWSLR